MESRTSRQTLGSVVPCIFKYSIKHPTRCTIDLVFIALSRRHRSTCFGHYCAHHQEPPPTAFAASGYRMIAGLDVFQTVVRLLKTDIYTRANCSLAYFIGLSTLLLQTQTNKQTNKQTVGKLHYLHRIALREREREIAVWSLSHWKTVQFWKT
jgi:hypothetical protein